MSLPHEAVGTDHGSLGVFQQQWPWWGTMTELMTPSTAARKFYRALLSRPAWQTQPVTVAAQSVQGSAYPDAYADDEALARQLLGLPTRGTSQGGAVPAAAAQAAGCRFGDSVAGDVVFPLPPASGYRDAHNFGHAGAHWASVHTGDDLSVACGTPVLAATAGTVIVRTDQPWAGRWLVQVSTGPGRLTTWYAHMRALTVADGHTVTAGQQIGEVGDLGNATGCHLHFEVHPQGGATSQDSVDPVAWLRTHRGVDVQVGGSVRSAAWSHVRRRVHGRHVQHPRHQPHCAGQKRAPRHGLRTRPNPRRGADPGEVRRRRGRPPGVPAPSSRRLRSPGGVNLRGVASASRHRERDRVAPRSLAAHRRQVVWRFPTSTATSVRCR